MWLFFLQISEREKRYEEVCNLLAEAQEDIKGLRRKQKPGFIRHHYTSLSPYVPQGSLALELEDSVKKDVEFPPGYSPEERMWV